MSNTQHNIYPIHSKNGKTYWVERGDMMYAQRLREGQYQKRNWQFAQHILNSFRTCVDIGSNNACNAVHYAEQFDHVHCFEPTDVAQAMWRNTVRDNHTHNVTLHTHALGEDQRNTTMLIETCASGSSGHSHVAHFDKNQRARRKHKRRVAPVVQHTLDSYQFDCVDFIKVDVEGYEWFVMQGAERTIQLWRPICQLEITEVGCRKFGHTPNDVVKWFQQHNYGAITKTQGRKTSWQHVPRDMDWFFVPNEYNNLPPTLALFDNTN